MICTPETVLEGTIDVRFNRQHSNEIMKFQNLCGVQYFCTALMHLSHSETRRLPEEIHVASGSNDLCHPSTDVNKPSSPFLFVPHEI